MSLQSSHHAPYETNIFIRHFTHDDREQSPNATALLARVEQGPEVVATSSLVIFEVVFTLERQYKLPKHDVAGLVLPFPIGFAAYMRPLGSSEVYTLDEDFDKVPGITRVDPGEEVG